MNIGKKKISSLESPEKTVDPSGNQPSQYLVDQFFNSLNLKCSSLFFFVPGYLNVLVNTHWRSRWCSVKDRQLWIYNDKSRSKVSQQPLSLEGCMVLPDPSPEHLYSFRIQMDGEELAILEVSREQWGSLLKSCIATLFTVQLFLHTYIWPTCKHPATVHFVSICSSEIWKRWYHNNRLWKISLL